MNDIMSRAKWMRSERLRFGLSTSQLAAAAVAAAARLDIDLALSQQTISNFEQGKAKREPGWLRYVASVFDLLGREQDAEEDSGIVYVDALPTRAGAGGGGTGEGDERQYGVDPSVLRYALRAAPADILAVEIEGNSMAPDFMSGDQVLVDRRRTSIAQPGAFCLWDGDGYVVKYLERVPGAEPPKVRVISKNADFSTTERLVDEIRIEGRIVWFARKV